ncbi:MAG TPA: hypothetical protein DGD08_08210 [Gemmatimonas aurantiaca]|uniref:C4-type zinc ribbon domain-containing protein n=2 Tax=Gemmatimonas aurantiaca TaxID=173480 RepID=C1A4A7_GEMAT|nr:hypothetical protein [Gemmatimonas aurantiaca]BAH38932.1 hypothetical protein GAU_1890 [Gemmatimonas aurantiaca T-27]HCT57182.1 hypothetical protein [Gemmatimonas aurantiaca]
MNPELQALLTVQQDDEVIRAIEARLEALLPRYNALEASRRQAAAEVTRNETGLERETLRLRNCEGKLADHRARLEKNSAVLDGAQKLKEATAAAAQVEAAKKAVAEEESELLTASRRVSDVRTAVLAHRDEVERLTAELEVVRASISAEKAAIEGELNTVRARRMVSAEGVSRNLLSQYDRLSSRRRTTVLHALRGDYSCGACDTAIPTQRRLAMATGTCIEPCEGCGVLLYYRPAPEA